MTNWGSSFMFVFIFVFKKKKKIAVLFSRKENRRLLTAERKVEESEHLWSLKSGSPQSKKLIRSDALSWNVLNFHYFSGVVFLYFFILNHKKAQNDLGVWAEDSLGNRSNLSFIRLSFFLKTVFEYLMINRKITISNMLSLLKTD